MDVPWDRLHKDGRSMTGLNVDLRQSTASTAEGTPTIAPHWDRFSLGESQAHAYLRPRSCLDDYRDLSCDGDGGPDVDVDLGCLD